MKKILVRILVLLLIFCGSTVVFSYLMYDENNIRTEEMSAASFPLVYMVYKGVDMNPLHGYTNPMPVTEVRDTLTPISTERNVSIKVQCFGSKVSDIYFEVFTADGKTSLENTKVTSIKSQDDYVTADFTLQSKLRMNQEYVLKIQLKSDNRNIYYYTRIVEQDSLHTKEYLDFVNMFSEKSLNVDKADSLAVYLEPEYDVEQNNLSFMDIHSDTELIAWKELSPQIYYKSIPAIKELNETTATIVQEYIISALDEQGNMELYTVDEYYRLRYADEAIMLLDFERTTNEIFNPDNGVITSNGINLGITTKDISFTTDETNQYFAFVLGGELWSYHLSSGKMAQVFTFRQKKNTDYRDIYGQHEIKIIDLSSAGNMYYVVAGYMNRGRHEGESGIALYYYDASSGNNEEKLFVNTEYSYDLLKDDVKELSYVTSDRENYCMLLDGDVYRINLATLEKTKLVEGINPGCSVGSGSGRRIAYLEENEKYDSRTIKILDLDTEKEIEITCGKKQRLQMLGFINESLVYGVAELSDIDASHEGDEFFPMSEVIIVNENGERIKEYAEVGVYVTSGRIEDKLLTMTRVKKSGDGWKEISEEHIIDNEVGDKPVGLTTTFTDRKQTQMLLLLGDATPKTPQVVRSNMVVSEESRKVTISAKEHKEERYYVYAKGKLDSIYKNANTAIVKADELLGVVVDQNQQYIWERGNKKTASAISLSSIPECIRQGNMNIEELQAQLPDKMVLNLAGCTMDQILYFISAGNPVIADTVDGIRVLIEYDQWGNIRFYEPGAEDTYLLSDEDSLELFEKSDNIFIGFLDKYKE